MYKLHWITNKRTWISSNFISENWMSAELSTTRKTTIISSPASRLLKIERGNYQLKTVPIAGWNHPTWHFSTKYMGEHVPISNKKTGGFGVFSDRVSLEKCSFTNYLTRKKCESLMFGKKDWTTQNHLFLVVLFNISTTFKGIDQTQERISSQLLLIKELLQQLIWNMLHFAYIYSQVVLLVVSPCLPPRIFLKQTMRDSHAANTIPMIHFQLGRMH